ncbi:MFS transporter [Microbulbifer aggregans]|uniref:MFS transporter n=1 Tax=Microbulbifer aggregans TaxID=1769779 RepID=UPI001CFD0F3E|nr:MFS transporter [Microbulbifer aggregans]
MLGSNFWLYLSGRFVHRFCFQALIFGISVWVIKSGDGGAAKAAFFSASSLLIAIVLPPLCAPISDRFCRRKVMLTADWLSLVPVAVLMVISLSGSLNYIYLCGLFWLHSLARGLFDSSSNSVLPQLVSTQNMGKAQVNLQASGSILSVISGLIGAYLATIVSLWQLFAICLSGILVSILSILRMQITALPPIQDSELSTKSNYKIWLEDLVDGWMYLRRLSVLWNLMWVLMVLNFIVAPFTFLVEVYVLRDLNLSARELGYTVLFSALGVLISTCIYHRYELVLKRWRYIVSFIVCLGPLFIAGGISNSFSAVLFMCLVKSMFVTFINVPLHVQIILAVHANYRSRVMNLLGMISGISVPMSLIIYGWAVEILDVHIVITILGFVIFLVAPLLWLNSYMARFMGIQGGKVAKWSNRLVAKGYID